MAQTQIIFGALIAIFTISMVFAGRQLEKKGPGYLMRISGILFAAGYIIASFSNGNFFLLFLGISLISGIATGFGYVCPLSTCVKWFPAHKGLVTGIAVAGFGGGAAILTTAAKFLLHKNVDVLIIFRGTGLLYGLILIAAAQFLKFPPSHKSKDTTGNLPDENYLFFKDPLFLGLALAMFCGTFAGLLVIGNLVPMAFNSGIETTVAAMGVTAFAFGNAAGRITWGEIVDLIELKVVPVSLFFLAAALGLMLFFIAQPVAFVIISFLIGFGFGACMVIHAALVATKYGPEKVGTIYPFIFLAYGVAGISGPFIGGWLHDTTDEYSSALKLSIIIVFAGLFVSRYLINKNHRPDQTAS
jgi:OFA family oxalate/formate antiporter-like MFS transporter